MKFRTKIDQTISPNKITHQCKMMLIGSCFSNNIGEQLKKYKFSATVNPFGTLYNPHSIAKSLRKAINREMYNSEDLQNSNGRYFNYDFHSDLSFPSESETLDFINKQLQKTKSCIEDCDFLFITFGTAWIYRLKEKNEIVGNCYKQASSNFEKEMMEVQQIQIIYQNLIAEILNINPKIKFIFTVSPIRHLKDGFHQNQLSKATLMLSIQKICEEFESCSYFPAYEIMMDDLRDYRFYSEDLIHPNQMALNYVWEVFSETYLAIETHNCLVEIEKFNKSLSHRAFNPEGEEHQKFLQKLKDKIQKFSNKRNLDYSRELEELEKKLIN